MKIKILGVGFDNLTLDEAKERFLGFLAGFEASNESKTPNEPAMVFTPNPEMVMLARKDADFGDLLNRADLVIPDGVGIVLASYLVGRKAAKNPIKQRVAGFDLAMAVLEATAATGTKWFFLGAAPGVAEEAKATMQARFEGLNVVGTHHGYFKESEEEAVVSQIAASGADAVFVGLGFPRQERFIDRYKERLGAKALMGVGGSLDVMSGKAKRAPKFFQKIGLEWFYRLCRQPSRIWRQRVLLKFALIVVYRKIRGVL
jgi:N-acetylglucosaminyldiphosphoundecaprenol N-acetyl-beta-D-mannosaminyltransferase